MMWMIVGLGNPGKQYEQTRHNIGFLVGDEMARSKKGSFAKEEFKAQTMTFTVDNLKVLFVRPQTFMNLSGESVQPLMNFYKVELEHLIVIHDEVDIPFGKMKIQKNRGHGGHNGVRSISQLLGSADYTRIRMGVGRPPHPEMSAADWVLSKFSGDEMKLLPDFLDLACRASESIIVDGHSKAATKFNS